MLRPRCVQTPRESIPLLGFLTSRQLYGMVGNLRGASIPGTPIYKCSLERPRQDCLLAYYSWLHMLTSLFMPVLIRFPLREALFYVFYDTILNGLLELIAIRVIEGYLTPTFITGKSTLWVTTARTCPPPSLSGR